MRGKRILIGISGGIAAYKVPMLVRQLVKAGAEVRVIATPAAFEFVTRATLAVLSGNAVHSEMLESETGEWNHHVEMGNWPDLFVIAPLTANTLAKMANGLCDNLVLATYLSAKCPVLVAPAMDLDMWRHPSVIQNIGRIKEFGNKIVGPESGDLASGLVGKGRMTEPEDIVDAIQHLLHG
jgi:phosphopantothenoylcysteine decarboxylase/phosphopantothenate--cysteine ligase